MAVGMRPFRLFLEGRKKMNPVAVAKLLATKGIAIKAAHAAVRQLVIDRDIVIELALDERVSVDWGFTKALWGNGVYYRLHEAPDLDPRRIRERFSMTQREFALRFGLDEGLVRNWEQKRSGLSGPARALLAVISFDPEAVSAALEAEGSRRRRTKEKTIQKLVQRKVQP